MHELWFKLLLYGRGLTAMLSSLVMVREVTIWDDIEADLDFDILVLRFGDVSVAAAGRAGARRLAARQEESCCC